MEEGGSSGPDGEEDRESEDGGETHVGGMDWYWIGS